MYYIVIRKQKDNDIPQISAVVRNAYASNIKNMFYGSLFNEATIQLIVILSAILFIFFHVPLLYCPFTIPLVLILMYLFIYGAVTMKSAQIMYEKKPLQGWVAEVYEPHFFIKDPKSCWYKIISEEELDKLDQKPEGRKRSQKITVDQLPDRVYYSLSSSSGLKLREIEEECNRF